MAQVLRHLWFTLPDPEFARLTVDMLEYRRLAEDLGRYGQGAADRVPTDPRLSDEVIEQLRLLLEPSERLTREEAAFLAKGVEFVDVALVDGSDDF